VAQSWSRCLNEYRLDPAKACEPAFVARVELEERRARRADVIACARYEMTTLYQQLADAEAAVVLTDTDGVIVHMVSSPEFAAEVGPLGLRVGGMWSETAAGTNGMGTCLAAAGPVSVRREDHFFTQFTQLTCSAVPVYDPSGEIAAVLDVTSRSSLMQQHLLVLLGMTARMIENRLIDARYATPTRCTSTAGRNSSTRCMKASWPSATMAASSPPIAARCSSSACSRWKTSARTASRTSSRPRWKTCFSAAPRRRSTRW
jgi:transcriptional regulator of acetoin/glycerol metabolism